MKYFHHIFRLISLALFCSSCSSNEVVLTLVSPPTATTVRVELVRPTSTFPGIITGVERKEGHLVAFQDEVCVNVDENWLWKPGYFWGDDSPQLNISVNGSQVNTPRRYITGPLITAFDKTGKIIGTHGFNIETCILLSTLTVKHDNVMKIEVAYQGETLLLDSWGFIVAN